MKDLNSGAHVSPNIQSNFEVYELENKSCDPDHKIEQFLEEKFDWSAKKVLDLGCGTGYHLPYFAQKANHVFGVEPHDASRLEALKRVYTQRAFNISVLKGTAESILLESESIDFACARFAYFWGQGCEKGLEEVDRVLKPGGSFVMIDNNLDRGTFGLWVKRSFSFHDEKQKETDAFWSEKGFEKEVIDSEWRFETRDDLKKVLKIEFPEDIYRQILSEHKGNTIDYTFNLFYKTKGSH